MFSLLKKTALPLLAGLAGLANFAQAAPLSFSAALDAAERQAPLLAANAAAIAAARAAALPAAALPDPKIFAGIDNFPVSGPDAGRLQADFMTMQKIGVSQEVPNAAKRQARAAVAAARVEVAEAVRRSTRQAVRRDTALAWIELYYLQQKESVFDGLAHENTLLATAVHTQIAAGRSTADAFAPQQEAAQLADRRDELARALAQARVRLRQLTGAAADDGLAGEPPAPQVDAAHLRTHVQQHPELATLAAGARQATAEVAEAEAAKKPDWGVELAFQRRAPQFGNMVSLQFSFELPLAPATRQDPLIAARRHEQARIAAERDAMQREHDAELEGMLAEHAALARQLERARSTALPLAEQKVALLGAAYQSGRSDLAALLAARRERLEQMLRTIELEAGLARAAARLNYALAEEQP